MAYPHMLSVYAHGLVPDLSTRSLDGIGEPIAASELEHADSAAKNLFTISAFCGSARRVAPPQLAKARVSPSHSTSLDQRDPSASVGQRHVLERSPTAKKWGSLSAP